MTEPPLALPDRVGVVNVGLSLFADAIREQGAPVISVDWRVPAGGQPDAVAALGRLYGIHAERIEAANAEVLRRLDAGHAAAHRRHHRGRRPFPAWRSRTLLHCGPAIGYADAPDPLRRSMRAAAVAEGWADSLEQAGRLAGRGGDRARPGQRAPGGGADGDRARGQRPAVRGGEPGRRHHRVRADLAGAGRGGLVRRAPARLRSPGWSSCATWPPR